MKLWLIFYGAILLAAPQAVAQSDADFSFAEGLASFDREDSDAAADSSTEATTSNGVYFIGFIEAADEDWIAVDLIEGQSVRIQVLGAESEMGTLEDPRFTLYNPQASEIGLYDDSNGSFEPDVVVTPEESGTHYIAVSGYDGAPGTYSLVVTDLLASLSTASSMSVNSDFFGTLGAGDEDWIAVDLIEGQSVRIQVLGAESEMDRLDDPLFTLYDPQASEIGFYDDSDDGSLEPDAIVTPAESGTHYIAVSGFFGSTGTYSIVVTAAQPAPAVSSAADGLASYREQGDAANGPETQAVMSVNSDFSGTLDAGDEDWVSDEDWIAVDLIEGQSVRIQAQGQDSGMGSLSDPVLSLYHPVNGLLGRYDDSSESLDPDTVFTQSRAICTTSRSQATKAQTEPIASP